MFRFEGAIGRQRAAFQEEKKSGWNPGTRLCASTKYEVSATPQRRNFVKASFSVYYQLQHNHKRDMRRAQSFSSFPAEATPGTGATKNRAS